MADLDKLKDLNLKLWQRVQQLELRATKILNEKKRESKEFNKTLLRISKWLDHTGVTCDQVREKLDQTTVSDSDSENSESEVILPSKINKRQKITDDPDATEKSDDDDKQQSNIVNPETVV